MNFGLFCLQLISVWTMFGIIWLIQLVHYPLMHWGDSKSFGAMSRFNQERTSWVVGGPMLIEAGCAVGLLVSDGALRHSAWYWVTIALLLLIWISTASYLVPLHRRLLRGFDVELIDGLVRRNWIRTAAWSLRAVILSWIGWHHWLIPQTIG